MRKKNNYPSSSSFTDLSKKSKNLRQEEDEEFNTTVETFIVFQDQNRYHAVVILDFPTEFDYAGVEPAQYIDYNGNVTKEFWEIINRYYYMVTSQL